jgi:NTE family protein
VLTAALLACACASFRASVKVDNEPRTAARQMVAQFAYPVVALVLSGGSARGFAHVGVIRVLEGAGLRPALIVGTSAGAVVGALYASGLSSDELLAAVRAMDAGVFDDFTLPQLGPIPGEMGMIRGERLQQFISEQVRGTPLESLRIPFAAVATDLRSGKPKAFNAGDTGLAVRASSSVPGLFAPPRIGGRLYADGQLVSPVPVSVARALGASFVIAVDVTYPSEQAELSGPIDVLFQSLVISTQRLKDYELGFADVVIRPEIVSQWQLDFGDREMLIAAGERAARREVEQIKGRLDRTGRSGSPKA